MGSVEPMLEPKTTNDTKLTLQLTELFDFSSDASEEPSDYFASVLHNARRKTYWGDRLSDSTSVPSDSEVEEIESIGTSRQSGEDTATGLIQCTSSSKNDMDLSHDFVRDTGANAEDVQVNVDAVEVVEDANDGHMSETSPRIETSTEVDSMKTCFCKFTALAKNVQSLQTDTRENELFKELELFHWDAICLSETWREHQRELWTSQRGHTFGGSGGTPGKHGVAIIINHALNARIEAFQAISERIAAMDFIAQGRKFRIIAVYMPHSGYNEASVEQVYEQIANLVKQGRRQRRTLVLAGDWNARVGQPLAGDDRRVLGNFAYGHRNARGQRLLDWALLQRMSILNTHFQKQPEKQWTYLKGDTKLHLDYVLCEWSKRQYCTDAKVFEEVTVGDDHRCVAAAFRFPTHGAKNLRPKEPKPSLVGWKCPSADDFNSSLQEKLDNLDLLQTATSIEAHILAIESALVETAMYMSPSPLREEGEDDGDEDELMERWIELRAARKQARAHNRKLEATQISKEINKIIRSMSRQRQKVKINKILKDFRGLKYIKSVKSNGKKHQIAAMRDKTGKVVTSRTDIANVFADFYEQLYAADVGAPWQIIAVSEGDVAAFRPFAASELRVQVKKMANGKAADQEGMVAELLKACDDKALELIADLFNSVMDPNKEIPGKWRRTSLKVIMKKGDALDPANYRPIASLPILYKLFSRCMCGRIGSLLDGEQSNDQAGFRKDFSCDDQLFVVRQLTEKANEMNLPLWVAAIDFQKAFDSFTHPSLWKALQEQGVPSIYINVLQRLYLRQTGNVSAGARSRDFPILKGSRQGDPISPILFNAVLEMAMRPCVEKWSATGWGWSLEKNQTNLLNLRFADDLLLLGRSHFQVQSMLSDIREAAAQVGLSLHFGKTKVLHNGRGQDVRRKSVKVVTADVEIVEVTDYLGSKLSLKNTMDCEVEHRVSRAWAKFATFWNELLHKKTNLFDRVRLFDSVVTPCALYGCGSWALTRAQEDKLKVAQRRMLRAILGKGRRKVDSTISSQSTDSSSDDKEIPDLPEDEVLESWGDWLSRTTHEALKVLEKVGAEDWVTVLRKRKWSWAEKVVNHSEDRWTSRILYWNPDEGVRSVGHPKLRWLDPIKNFATSLSDLGPEVETWICLLKNKQEATRALPEFLKYCEDAHNSFLL